MSHLYALILAGGGGTRLWPKSREKTPKQFLKLGMPDSLLRSTALRVNKMVNWKNIYVITNITQLPDVRRELPELSADQIICEPQKRETAMAMAVGAMVIQQKDPKAVVLNFASDHVVQNVKAFQDVMQAAAEMAEDTTKLVTVGIQPSFAHTGLGYIKRGKKLQTLHGLPVYAVENFTEKPNLEKAQEFLSTGMYFWNANNYTWSVQAIMDAFKTNAPATFAVLESLRKHVGKSSFKKALEKAYDSVEAISIDYAISEKAKNLVLIPGDFGWNDIGDWKVVYDLAQQDAQQNVKLVEEKGDIILYNSTGNLVHTQGKLVALVGMKDTVVIDTGEIVLVMAKDKTQDVKKVVEQLKANKQKRHL